MRKTSKDRQTAHMAQEREDAGVLLHGVVPRARAAEVSGKLGGERWIR